MKFLRPPTGKTLPNLRKLIPFGCKNYRKVSYVLSRIAFLTRKRSGVQLSTRLHRFKQGITHVLILYHYLFIKLSLYQS